MAVKYLLCVLKTNVLHVIFIYKYVHCIISNREVKQPNNYGQKKKLKQLMKITQNYM